MSAIEELEQRVANLEVEMAELKQEKGPPWWEAWFGAFANDPHFEQAMKLGRKIRETRKVTSAGKRRRKHDHS